jgi:sulfite reductase alpha subunit-like flavoprotein
MADYKVRGLKDEQDLLVIVSTYGEGDPPQPSIAFFEFLEGKRAPRLENVRFSVLALGDSTYEKYCEAGKRIDTRLEELGAQRIGDRVDCDIDYDDPAAAWSGAVIDRLAADLAASAAPSLALVPATAASAPSAHDKKNPFAATVLENLLIVGRHSTKETRHLELDLSGSSLTYEPGDALGIAAVNAPELVESVLEATGLAADAPVTVKGETIPLAEALTRRFEITTASPRFIDQWAKLSGARRIGCCSSTATTSSTSSAASRCPASTRRACSPASARCSRGFTRSRPAWRRSMTKRTSPSRRCATTSTVRPAPESPPARSPTGSRRAIRSPSTSSTTRTSLCQRTTHRSS